MHGGEVSSPPLLPAWRTPCGRVRGRGWNYPQPETYLLSNFNGKAMDRELYFESGKSSDDEILARTDLDTSVDVSLEFIISAILRSH